MDFDQMLTAWQAQDNKPIYGVNQDLLRLVLRNEQADIRRTLRRDQWITYLVGPGMALFAAFWLWVAMLRGAPVLHVAAAGIGAVTFALWVGAYWTSRRRQARRERSFGNTLQEEIRRNLSLVDYQITHSRWEAVLMWTVPVIGASLLVYWLTFQINQDSGFSIWTHLIVILCTVGSVFLTAHTANRAVKQTLEPRRERLRGLLDTLHASE